MNPRTFSSSALRAHTTVTPPAAPLPIHFLCPCSRQPPSTRSARVSSETESEPWVGSVSAKAP